MVYSTADKASFKTAEKALQQLWKNDTVRSKAVILVANKADLVRSRVVSNQGKYKYFCNFSPYKIVGNKNKLIIIYLNLNSYKKYKGTK